MINLINHKLAACVLSLSLSLFQRRFPNCCFWLWPSGARSQAWFSSSSSSCRADGATRRDRGNCAGAAWRRRLLGKRGKTRQHGKTRVEPGTRRRLWNLKKCWEAGHGGTPGDGAGVSRSFPAWFPSFVPSALPLQPKL